MVQKWLFFQLALYIELPLCMSCEDFKFFGIRLRYVPACSASVYLRIKDIPSPGFVFMQALIKRRLVVMIVSIFS